MSFWQSQLETGSQKLEQQLLISEPGSPWENGYCESVNARFKDEFLNGETFYTLKEARILIEQWRVHYNIFRPHRFLNWKPPAPESLFQVNPIIDDELTFNLDHLEGAGQGYVITGLEFLQKSRARSSNPFIKSTN